MTAVFVCVNKALQGIDPDKGNVDPQDQSLLVSRAAMKKAGIQAPQGAHFRDDVRDAFRKGAGGSLSGDVNGRKAERHKLLQLYLQK